MTRSQRLSPVLKLALTRKRNAAVVAAKAAKLLREYEHKLAELQSYRADYAMLDRSDGQLVNASQLQERQKFILQLDEGIEILKLKVKGQQQVMDVDKQQWLDAHKHNDAIDKLMGRLRDLELNLRETRESDALDDRAQHSKPRY